MLKKQDQMSLIVVRWDMNVRDRVRRQKSNQTCQNIRGDFYAVLAQQLKTNFLFSRKT
jgi:hypothetical protein